jgi:hypothetical protein
MNSVKNIIEGKIEGKAPRGGLVIIWDIYRREYI